jgi:5-bromo-4-chloroindolyl phosphate hydrolysis protein
MHKMVKSAALLFCGLCTLKKNGRLMTHHNGLTHTHDVWVCTRIEECRQNDLTISKTLKREVINKDNVTRAT